VDLGTMAYVPAGTFIMGYTEPYPRNPKEIETLSAMPAHVVYLDAFYIDRYEVVYADYVRFLNAMGAHELACDGFHCAYVCRPDEGSGCDILLKDGEYLVRPGFENLPMGDATWYGAAAYCTWQGKRLPTEAEWEKAARGTDGRLYPWGNEWDPRGATDILKPHAIGSQAINIGPYGVYDMLGNATEWMADWYAQDYYAYSPSRNPTGPMAGEYKAVRSQPGPGFALPSRYYRDPTHLYGGFRCAYSSE
jgi:sulfatase modifying factor 1